MQPRDVCTSRAVAPFLALVCAVAPAAAQGYRAENFTAAPPQELAAPVAVLLSDRAVRVIGPNGTYCEIWFRKEIPAAATTSATLGVAYPALSEGTLVGAVRFVSAANDFRNRAIQPGVYTLRYGRHPVDGNHMGVAPHRDFLLASPAAADADTEAKAFDPLVALSSKASGTTHPSVWSLMPPEDPPPAVPAVVEHPDEALWVLYTSVRILPAGGQAGDLRLAVVVVGHAPEA